MPKVVNSQIVKPCALAQTPPWLLHVGQMLTLNGARDDVRIVLQLGYGLEDVDSCLADRDQFCAALGVWET